MYMQGGSTGRNVRACAMSALFIFAFGIWSRAGAETWSQKPFQYVAVDQDVRDVLRELSTAASVPIEMSDAVRGQAHGRWSEMGAGEFLSRFAHDYGLDWYYDGSLLSVSASSETKTRLLSLHGVQVDALRSGLVSAGLLDERFGLRDGPVPDTAMVTGPPHFVAIVQQSVEAAAPTHLPTVAPPAASAVERLTIYHGSQRPVVVTF